MLREVDFPIAEAAFSESPKNDFGQQQRALSHFNQRRLAPGLGETAPFGTVDDDAAMLELERAFVTQARAEIAPWLVSVPDRPQPFIRWFETLKEIGPG